MKTRLLPGFRVTVMAIALAALLLAAPSVWAQTDAVHRKILPATGWVVVNKDKSQLGYGTCWIVDLKKRLVVTNVHVVAAKDKVRVAFPRLVNGQLITSSAKYGTQDFIGGKVIARDAKRDLALIQLDKLPAGAKALELAPDSIEPGGLIWAVGNSGMAGKDLTKGTLWRPRKGTAKKGFFFITNLNGTKQTLETRVILTDSGSMPGDSGGPVVDEHGRLVGVNSCSNEHGDYAVDVNEVRVFLARWLSPPKVPPSAKGPVGTWTVKWKFKDADCFAGLVLNGDGTGQWDGAKLCPGTFSYADGNLTLKMPGSGLDVTIALVWDGDNVFRFIVRTSIGPVEYTVTRR